MMDTNFTDEQVKNALSDKEQEAERLLGDERKTKETLTKAKEMLKKIKKCVKKY